MWPRKGRTTSTGMIDGEVWRMTVPNQGSGRDKTSVDDEHAMRYPMNIREEGGFGRRSREKNEVSQREEREDRIGWRQWFGGHCRVWFIRWSRRFESIRRIWRTGRLRWSMLKGWACSKWKTKSGKVDEDAKDSVHHHDRKSHLFPFLAHTGGCAV